MAAVFGGPPGWWLEADDTMLATAYAVLDDIRGR